MPTEAYISLLVLLPIAVIVIGLGVWAMEAKGRWAFLREVGLVLGAFAIYFAARGFTQGDVATATNNAFAIIDLQERLGIFVEPTLQEAVIAYDWVIATLNWIYTWGHWPVIGALAIWLYRFDQPEYRLFRNAFLISGGISLMFFIFYPVAPPRLVDVGMLDTLMKYSTSYEVLQPSALVNQYAAMPSLHFGWNLLVAIAIVRQLRGRGYLLRFTPSVLPVLMLSSIVLTANHYLLDALAGGIVSVAGLMIAMRLPPRNELLHSVPPRWRNAVEQRWTSPLPVSLSLLHMPQVLPEQAPEKLWRMDPTSVGLSRFLD